jgi:hypothetical protein
VDLLHPLQVKSATIRPLMQRHRFGGTHWQEKQQHGITLDVGRRRRRGGRRCVVAAVTVSDATISDETSTRLVLLPLPPSWLRQPTRSSFLFRLSREAKRKICCSLAEWVLKYIWYVHVRCCVLSTTTNSHSRNLL